jgi:mannitol-1-phosphate/altronate dehydrogenase
LNYQIDFVDVEERLLKLFQGRNAYLTATAWPSGYAFDTVRYRKALHLDDVRHIEDCDVVFTSVGPRNCLRLADLLSRARVAFLLENEWDLSQSLRRRCKNPEIYMGIPDVITSNTAPSELLSRDPLCVVSESGRLILARGRHSPPMVDGIAVVDETALQKHWLCKFYIHNASHAVVAFLGAVRGHTYVHEAMADSMVGPVVTDAMKTVTRAIIHTRWVDEAYAERYLAMEIARFQNPLLYDPICRVARDPLRKLDHKDRLIQALLVVRRVGLDTYPFLLAIRAALEYQGSTEEDHLFREHLRRNSLAQTLRDVCRLDETWIEKILELDPLSDHESVEPCS